MSNKDMEQLTEDALPQSSSKGKAMKRNGRRAFYMNNCNSCKPRRLCRKEFFKEKQAKAKLSTAGKMPRKRVNDGRNEDIMKKIWLDTF
jgi:hypothetical protein